MIAPIAPLAILFACLLAALAILQISLLAGMPLGRFAWGGQQDRLAPRRRAAAAASVAVYALFAGVALAHVHLIATPVPTSIINIAMWVLAVYLVLSVLPNVVSKSISERRLMIPVSAVLATLAVLVAMS